MRHYGALCISGAPREASEAVTTSHPLHTDGWVKQLCLFHFKPQKPEVGFTRHLKFRTRPSNAQPSGAPAKTRPWCSHCRQMAQCWVSLPPAFGSPSWPPNSYLSIIISSIYFTKSCGFLSSCLSLISILLNEIQWDYWCKLLSR